MKEKICKCELVRNRMSDVVYDFLTTAYAVFEEEYYECCDDADFFHNLSISCKRDLNTLSIYRLRILKKKNEVYYTH